jgi:hypothetical protein
VHQFNAYLADLEALLRESQQSYRAPSLRDAIGEALDGGPSRELSSLVPRAVLKQQGIFFTHSTLAARVYGRVAHSLDRRSVIFDPACGCGDLLLHCLPSLRSRGNLQATLERWGTQLAGIDVHHEFVQISKARLALAAVTGALPTPRDRLIDARDLFPLIRQGSGLEAYDLVARATHILLNPPYTRIEASPSSSSWAAGPTNAAAVFLAFCLEHARPKTRIVAILPEVLRSGTTFRRWRAMVASRCTNIRVSRVGQFNASIDIDVFILDLTIAPSGYPRSRTRWGLPSHAELGTVGDHFSVRVGSVVDYRDPRRGQRYPYLTARSLGRHKRLTSIQRTRRFQGTVHAPPFVVIKRTSRPSESPRIVARIVTGPGSVAIDNHLIVASPIEGGYKACQNLLRVLRDTRTQQWVNSRIACRHLTVDSVAGIPWWENP